MRIVFFGTPEFSVPFLKALDEDEDLIVSAVVCQPDKPIGRKKILTAPPTKQYALEHGIPVFQPVSLKDAGALHTTPLRDADLFVVVAYGKIIPQAILDIPTHGTINVHPSLLPKYRGPSPMQAAIANQDNETGVSIMLLDAKMDHGPILAQERIRLDRTETYLDLQTKVHVVGAPLLVQTIKDFTSGMIESIEQNHPTATFCSLLSREDGEIDWNEPAEAIEAKLRAYTPWPGSWTMWDGKVLKIHAMTVGAEHAPPLRAGEHTIVNDRLFFGTASNPIEVLELQPEGKQRMRTPDFLRGLQLTNSSS